MIAPKRGNTNKRKGSNAERLYAAKFRELGFSKCITSREGSKLLDDCAVDLMFVPLLVQIKAGRQKNMNPSRVLKDIEERIREHFPAEAPEQNLPRILIHYKSSGSGIKRTEYDELVTMTFETFKNFLKSYLNDLQRNTTAN